MIYCYVRVSSRTQKLDRQLDKAKNYKYDVLVEEKASGKSFIGREKYLEMKAQMREGDELIIHSLDRLGRNYAEIRDEWNSLNKMGINITVLDMDILNTKADDNDITKKLIKQIVFELLAYFAQKERENTLQRQKEGIESARKRNVKFGRPKVTEFPKDFINAYKLYSDEKITLKYALKLTEMPSSTFYDYKKRYEAQLA